MKIDKKRAFTIVELVIVIAVVAILAAVLIPTFSSVIEKATDSQFRQNARNYLLEKAIEDFLSDSKTEGKTSKPSEPEESAEDTFAMITYSNGNNPKYIKASDLPSLDEYQSPPDLNSSSTIEPILTNVIDPEIKSSLSNKYVNISDDCTFNIYLTRDGYIFMSSGNRSELRIKINTKSSMPFYNFYGMPSMLSGLEADPYQLLYSKWDDIDKNPMFESPKTYKDSNGDTITLTIYG